MPSPVIYSLSNRSPAMKQSCVPCSLAYSTADENAERSSMRRFSASPAEQRENGESR